ncbi:MAG: OadG family transporter subunit [Spirochaetota bacterium]
MMILGMVIVILFIEIMIFLINLFHIIINRKQKKENEVDFLKTIISNNKIMESKEKKEDDFIDKQKLNDQLICAIFMGIKEYESQSRISYLIFIGVKMPKKIGITDIVLKDAHQSLLATRMLTSDMLPICDKLDKVGYHSLEV